MIKTLRRLIPSQGFFPCLSPGDWWGARGPVDLGFAPTGAETLNPQSAHADHRFSRPAHSQLWHHGKVQEEGFEFGNAKKI